MKPAKKIENYEFVFIFSHDSTEQNVRGFIADYTNLIKADGGDITKTEFCGMRTFAYPINKTKKGYYVLLNVRVQPSFLHTFKKKLKNEPKVVRHLFTQVDKLDPNPSALLQQRHNLDVVYKTQIRSGKVYEDGEKE